MCDNRQSKIETFAKGSFDAGFMMVGVIVQGV